MAALLRLYDPETLQEALNQFKDKVGLPALVPDGRPGKRTMKFIETLLGSQLNSNWSDARKLLAAEQFIYKHRGYYEGDIDGLVGEMTRYARSVYEARQKGDTTAETWRDEKPKTPTETTAPAPVKTVWPRQNAAEMDRFFGPKGENQVELTLPFPMRIAWEPDRQIYKFSCNKRVHDPMKRIWTRVLAEYGYDKVKELRLDMYGGCLNVRKMRGGSAWSIHSWGCAYDCDPDRNQLKFKRNSATLDEPVYKPYWKFIYDEGAIGLGPERDYDWMHFQFARL